MWTYLLVSHLLLHNISYENMTGRLVYSTSWDTWWEICCQHFALKLDIKKTCLFSSIINLSSIQKSFTFSNYLNFHKKSTTPEPGWSSSSMPPLQLCFTKQLIMLKKPTEALQLFCLFSFGELWFAKPARDSLFNNRPPAWLWIKRNTAQKSTHY